MAELLLESGGAGALIMLLAVPGVLVGLAAIITSLSTKTRRLSVVLAGAALGLAGSALLLGSLGKEVSLARAYHAVAHAAPDDRPVLLRAGANESRASEVLGTWVGLPLALVGGLVMASAFARTHRHGRFS